MTAATAYEPAYTLAELAPRLLAFGENQRAVLEQHLVPHLGALELDAIDREAALSYAHARREEGLPAKEINAHLSVLRAALAAACQWGLRRVALPVLAYLKRRHDIGGLPDKPPPPPIRDPNAFRGSLFDKSKRPAALAELAASVAGAEAAERLTYVPPSYRDVVLRAARKHVDSGAWASAAALYGTSPAMMFDILGALCSCIWAQPTQNNGAAVWPGMQRIAYLAGRSLSSAKRAIRALRFVGQIYRVPRERESARPWRHTWPNESNLYYVFPSPDYLELDADARSRFLLEHAVDDESGELADLFDSAGGAEGLTPIGAEILAELEAQDARERGALRKWATPATARWFEVTLTELGRTSSASALAAIHDLARTDPTLAARGSFADLQSKAFVYMRAATVVDEAELLRVVLQRGRPLATPNDIYGWAEKIVKLRAKSVAGLSFEMMLERTRRALRSARDLEGAAFWDHLKSWVRDGGPPSQRVAAEGSAMADGALQGDGVDVIPSDGIPNAGLTPRSGKIVRRETLTAEEKTEVFSALRDKLGIRVGTLAPPKGDGDDGSGSRGPP